MATPEMIAEQEALNDINADYKEQFGFHDSETDYAYKAPEGPDARASSSRSPSSRTSPSGCSSSA